MNIKKLQDGIYHIFEGDPNASMLTRYGILKTGVETDNDGVCEETESGIVFHASKGDITFLKSVVGDGYTLTAALDKKERLFGGGDCNRKQLMLRGLKIVITLDDYVSYGPMPILLSDKGWAILLNTTYKSQFDCGAANPDELAISVKKGDINIYLFKADSLKGLIDKLTTVTGKPTILPKTAYGLTMVNNDENINSRELLWDVKATRDENIPCDTMGLEPKWMEKFYDLSIDKKWDPTRFYVPKWAAPAGDFTFFYPLRMMGMNLSLWLCCDYDLLWYEDGLVKEEEKEENVQRHIVDEHLGIDVKSDKITDRNVPWFEHLKKFVDQGVSTFKMDACKQVLNHSDRLWGGKYFDDEVHNIYNVLLSKQMVNGFKEYTDRRLFYYTAGAYVGTQQFSATWAGDTGGEASTVLSILNQAMCGHTNTTVDLEVKYDPAIHYGFFLPWAQYMCWSSWKFPWFMGDKKQSLIQYYANLRSSLVPYIYTMARKAYDTGLAIVRPLSLMYEDTDRFDNVFNAYMFGDKLYVGVFDMNLKLPEGRWIDYFTGDVYEGDISYEIPEGKGGALFVKEGSVFVTMKPQKYVLEKEHDYIINVYPGSDDTFSLYEDDGFTYDYQDGKYCTTDIRMENSSEKGFDLTVCKRQGSFDGRPDNGHDIVNNGIPEVKPVGEVRDMLVKIFGKKPASVKLGTSDISFEYADGASVFTLPADVHKSGDVTFKITY